MALAALYQTGVIRRMPDVSFPNFDSNKVMSSPQAYEILGMPDAPLAVASYAMTAGLAAMGGLERGGQLRFVTLMMAGKVVVDSFFAAKLVRDQFVRQHRTFCIWCLSTSAVTLSMLLPALCESTMALRASEAAAS